MSSAFKYERNEIPVEVLARFIRARIVELKDELRKAKDFRRRSSISTALATNYSWLTMMGESVDTPNVEA